MSRAAAWVVFADAGGPPGRGRGAGLEARPEIEPVAYAPTYYPGVPSVNDARAVTVGLGAESAGIDFNVLLVRTSRVTGRVTDADGFPAWSGNVTLIAEGAAGGRAPGQNYGGRINWDGAFSIAGVPPGPLHPPGVVRAGRHPEIRCSAVDRRGRHARTSASCSRPASP